MLCLPIRSAVLMIVALASDLGKTLFLFIIVMRAVSLVLHMFVQMEMHSCRTIQ